MKFGYAADNMEITLTNVSFAYPTTGARTVGHPSRVTQIMSILDTLLKYNFRQRLDTHF